MGEKTEVQVEYRIGAPALNLPLNVMAGSISGGAGWLLLPCRSMTKALGAPRHWLRGGPGLYYHTCFRIPMPVLACLRGSPRTFH